MPPSAPIQPPPVRPGDRVGVAALSGPVDPTRLARGLDGLRALGFEPVVADNLPARTRLFAGGDAERLAAFHRLADDPALTAIFFARGGWGALRLFPELDWDRLARTPRAYIGYSDLTPFLLGVVERLGLVSFHGPMVAADFARGLAPAEAAVLLSALAGGEVSLPVAGNLRAGQAEGPVLGGCLSLLTAVLGTEFATRFAGALLFVEDVQEPLYRLDRMLTHLRLSGSLNGVRGLIGTVFPGPGVEVAGDRTAGPAGWHAALLDAAASFDGPVAWGLSSGHEAPNWTLPLGRRARLDTREGRLNFL